MAIKKPVKVETKSVTSTDIISFNGGMDERGDANAEANTFIASRNCMVNLAGLLTHRLGLKRWLPDTVETVYQVYPAVFGTHLYYFVADAGKMKYCQAGDLAWTVCGGGVTNAVTTGPGIITTFLRIQDKIIPLNGKDKLRFVDLNTLAMTQFLALADPLTIPTATATVLTLTGSFKIYYSINFNSTVGQTKIAPIFPTPISKARGQWKTDGSEFVTISRANTPPVGAVSWNIWVSTSPAGSSIQTTDMLLLAAGLDLTTSTFVDNGALPISISGGTAPEDNATDGMIATYGQEDKGRPILWGDPLHGHSLYIGGDGDNALDFSPNNGGYVIEMNKGTNYTPMGVIGFRNGQGIPSLTVLFSNTQGLSKQAIIEQTTVTYGNTSMVVWAVTEQNYGAAGVSSPYAIINYLGELIFPTTDGIVTMMTRPATQNVLSMKRVSDRIYQTISSIKNDSLNKIVGTAWSNRAYFSVPSRGYTFNNEIIVYDLTNSDNPIWYTFDIKCQWIGTVSPISDAAFVYVCQDNHIYRLEESYVALDDAPGGSTVAFPVSATGSLIGTNQAHNSYIAVMQAVFYLQEVIGQVQIGVTYRNESGKMKTKTRLITQGQYAKSAGGGWSSPGYLYQEGVSTYNRWSDIPQIADANIATKTTIREPIPLNNVLTSEMQWFINTNLDNSSFILRSVSYEGITVGVRGDLR